MSSEILNSLSGKNKELIDLVGMELAQQEQEDLRQEAIRIAHIIRTGRTSASQPEVAVEPVVLIPDVVRIKGSTGFIDLRNMESQIDRAALLKEQGIQANEIEAVNVPPTYPAYPKALSGVNAYPAAEKGRKFRPPTRKEIVVGSLATALVVGGVSGGLVTNGYGTGITIPGLKQDQAGAEANVANVAIAADPAPAETAAAPAPEVKLNPVDIAIGDCLSSEGQGKSLASAAVTFGANQNYKLKTLSGEEVLLVNGEAKPRIEIPEANVNVAACIPAEARKDAIVVDGNKVTINWDKIDRQLGVVPGAGSPTVEVWDMDAEPGVTDRATVTALIASMADSANQAAAVNIARAEFGKKIIAESEPALQSKLTEALKAEVGAQITALHAAKKAPTAEVTIEFTGTPKPVVYVGPTHEPTTAFEVVDVSAPDNDDNPETPLLPVEFK